MLVGTDYGRADPRPPHLAQVGAGGEGLEQGLEAARADPSAEPVVDRVPRAELARPVPPPDAGASPVRDGLEEQAVGQDGRPAAPEPLGPLDVRAEDRPEAVREQVPPGVRASRGRRVRRNRISDKGQERLHALITSGPVSDVWTGIVQAWDSTANAWINRGEVKAREANAGMLVVGMRHIGIRYGITEAGDWVYQCVGSPKSSGYGYDHPYPVGYYGTYGNYGTYSNYGYYGGYPVGYSYPVGYYGTYDGQYGGYESYRNTGGCCGKLTTKTIATGIASASLDCTTGAITITPTTETITYYEPA